MGRSTGAGKGTPAAWRSRRRIAVYEAPALAVFLGILPLSVFAATAVWAFDGDRERRFLLLMVCLGPAALGVLVLGLYVLLRGMLRPADVVAGALYDESAGAGLPPALPRSVPGRGGWPLLTWAWGTAFAGGLVAFWFLGVGEPGEDGRLHSTGELWLWGGALAVIALYCALNVEGAVSRVLPGRTRAVRGTVRRGHVVVAAAGGDPRGPLSVDLRIPGLDPDEAADGLEGLDLWLCWDTRRAKRDFAQDGPPRLDCAALLVFDGGQAVRARALFPPGRSPWAEGAPTGSPEAPVDPDRRVAVWNPRSTWPLTLTAPAYGLYALAGVCAGGLFTEGAPRGLLAVGGVIALVLARAQHFPPMYERALAPAWYRDRSPTGPDRTDQASVSPVRTDQASASTDRTDQASTSTDRTDQASASTDRTDQASTSTDRTDQASASTDRTDQASASTDRTDQASASTDRTDRASPPDRTDQASPLPTERPAPGADRVRRALRRLPVLVALATLVPLSAVVSLGAWLVWPDREERLAVTAGGLAVSAGVLVVLLVHRIATGRIHPYEIKAVRGTLGTARESVPGSRLRKGRYLFGAIGVGGWLAGLVFLIPAGDVTSSPLIDRLRAEGAVVAEVTIENAHLVERHYSTKKGGGRGPQYAVTQKLAVRLPTDSGSFDFATVRTMSAQARGTGDHIKVIYAPGNTALGAYIGGDSRSGADSWLGSTQGYQDDLQRLLDDRALSGRQLVLFGIPWALATVICVSVAHATRLNGPDAPPSWPLTIPYACFVTAALALAGSGLLLTDRVDGLGRLVLGAATAFCAVLSLTTRFATEDPEGDDSAQEKGQGKGRGQEKGQEPGSA
ncbi:hypothetical protein ACQZM9_16180 [Streptomyces sp. P11-1]|uniref:hypothetical protein n=1 Tax=Streptomyces sp. P11-1 TaxID=3423221 RepID=UPI003D2EABD2